MGIAGIPFEDEKISFEQLVEKRGPKGRSASIPLGSLPVMTLPDGKVVTQSMALARYAAKLAKMYPDDPLQALFVDEIMETVAEVTIGIPRNTLPDYQILREEYAAGKLAHYFSYISKKLREVDGPYIFGTDPTVADLLIYGMLKHFRKGILDHIPADYDAKWPAFQTLVEALESDPKFTPYII